MATRRINPRELAVGAMLGWDVVGDDGALLARRGHCVASDKQLVQLLGRGHCVLADAAPAVCERRAKTSSADAELAAVFIRALGIYPIGTVVRLLNGEIGIVTGKGGSNTCPQVAAVVGPRGAPLDLPIRRDTARASLAIHEALHPDQAALALRLDQLWGELASA